MLGADRLAYWARQYGFGAPTGIDLPGEVSGIVPNNKWKMNAFGQPMFQGETYQAGIGQGYDVVTPIQLINAYAALANGGKLYRPQIVRRGRRSRRQGHHSRSSPTSSAGSRCHRRRCARCASRRATS